MTKQKNSKNKKRKSLLPLLYPLFGILFLVWLIILGEFVIIAGWIVDIPNPVSNGLMAQILVAIGKVGLSGLLVLGWLYLWNRIVKIYFNWALKNNSDLNNK